MTNVKTNILIPRDKWDADKVDVSGNVPINFGEEDKGSWTVCGVYHPESRTLTDYKVEKFGTFICLSDDEIFEMLAIE